MGEMGKIGRIGKIGKVGTNGTNGINGGNREDREFKELRELWERLSLNSLNSLNSLISYFNQHTDFSSERCSSGADMKKVRMGCTKAYCSFGLLIEASLMRRYHEKEISCQKGLDLAYRKSEHPRIVQEVQPRVLNFLG